MLGQPASWQTVCRPSRSTRPRRCENCGPMVAFTLIHGGLRSIGVSALRASMRSIRRPSGATSVTCAAYVARGPAAAGTGGDTGHSAPGNPVVGDGSSGYRGAYGDDGDE